MLSAEFGFCYERPKREGFASRNDACKVPDQEALAYMRIGVSIPREDHPL